MLLSGGALIAVDQTLARFDNAVRKADLFGDGQPSGPAPRISGPLNILLAGIEPRTAEEVPRADSVMVMHLAKELDRAYLFSLPRDLLVAIPAFPKSGFAGAGMEKLAHAMFFGAQDPDGGLPDPAQGFELLAQTVGGYTGIERFDAGAIIDLGGFSRVVDALGGVETQAGAGEGHQRLMRATLERAFSAAVLGNPAQFNHFLHAAGSSLIFSGRGTPLLEWAFTLRELKPHNLTLIHLRGGEQLDIEAFSFFDSLLDGSVDSYVVQHPEMISGPA